MDEDRCRVGGDAASEVVIGESMMNYNCGIAKYEYCQCPLPCSL